jgi:hypothetical protein
VYIGIQIVEHGLSADTMIMGGMGKPLQVRFGKVEFGGWSAVHYIFSESQ